MAGIFSSDDDKSLAFANLMERFASLNSVDWYLLNEEVRLQGVSKNLKHDRGLAL